MRLVYAILVVQYTVHVQGRIANFAFWKWFLRPLLSSSITNLAARENVLKSRFAKNLTREIYGVYSNFQLTTIIMKSILSKLNSLSWQCNFCLSLKIWLAHVFRSQNYIKLSELGYFAYVVLFQTSAKTQQL